MRLRKGRSGYLLPQGTDRILCVQVRCGGIWYVIQMVNALDHIPRRENGRPTIAYFNHASRALLFAPIPDKSYYVEISYSRREVM